MTYKKYLIIASKLDRAGINITTQLSQFQNESKLSSIIARNRKFDENKSEEEKVPDFKFYLVDEEIIYTKNLDLEKINHFDFIIFASKHKSAKEGKTLSIHAPGNFKGADYGGEIGKVCPSSGQFQKQMFEKLKENSEKFHLNDYNITLESTHHGPLIEKPCVFIEIGSTENEWKNPKPAFVIAKTIYEIMKEFKENPYREVAFAIGGPHYCPNFNKIQLKSNVAISHVIPNYALPLTEEMVKEALEKTKEDVEFAILDWKGLGNKESREQVVKILDKLYVRYVKTSGVNKG